MWCCVVLHVFNSSIPALARVRVGAGAGGGGEPEDKAHRDRGGGVQAVKRLCLKKQTKKQKQNII